MSHEEIRLLKDALIDLATANARLKQEIKRAEADKKSAWDAYYTADEMYGKQVAELKQQVKDLQPKPKAKAKAKTKK